MFDEVAAMRMPWSRWGLVLGGLAVSVGWAQKESDLPRFHIQLPSAPGAKRAEVAYKISAGEFYAYLLPPDPNKVERADCHYEVGPHGLEHPGVSRQVCNSQPQVDPFSIDASVGGTAADRVRAVVFIPGCETSALDVSIQSKREGREAKCVPLPLWTLKGQVADVGIPKKGSLKVDVAYRANWVSRLFEVGQEQPNVFNRPLIEFDVAYIRLSKGRSFSVELPILARDPGELSAAPEDRGELFTLRNGDTGAILGILRPDQFATRSDGLELRTEYPELRFVLEHD
jgi:hypothetical protein